MLVRFDASRQEKPASLIPPAHCVGRLPRNRTCLLALGAVATAVLFGAVPTGHAHELDGYEEARLSIRTDDLSEHVGLLADDSLEGREAGSRGGYAAGNYLVRSFQQHLEPAAGQNEFFQLFGSRYRNILGVMPGSDPNLADEYILIGAHYDHVGYGSRRNSNGPIGYIHNGADDNASGTAALLEVLEALASSSLRPKRSILFALWDGEEKGLLGSEHWVTHPTLPLSQVKMIINVDMVGRLGDKSLEILGSRSMAGLRHLVAEANYPDDLRLAFPWEIEENSDHHSFFSRGLPFLMFHTGLHDDYHTPRDDADAIDFEGLEATSRLMFNTLILLANRESLGPCRSVAKYETASRQREFEQARRAPAPRLGISWDPPTHDAPGVKVRRVAFGSAAERAGLHVEDRIVSVNGHPLLSSSTLQQVVVTARDLTLQVVRDGDSAAEDVEVELSGPPTRIGMSWRTTPAEPERIIVSQVIRHSIADQAGLKVGDRVYQINGQTFAGASEFYELAMSAALPASILIERDGRLQELRLPTLPRELVPAATPATELADATASKAVTAIETQTLPAVTPARPSPDSDPDSN